MASRSPHYSAGRRSIAARVLLPSRLRSRRPRAQLTTPPAKRPPMRRPNPGETSSSGATTIPADAPPTTMLAIAAAVGPQTGPPRNSRRAMYGNRIRLEMAIVTRVATAAPMGPIQIAKGPVRARLAIVSAAIRGTKTRCRPRDEQQPRSVERDIGHPDPAEDDQHRLGECRRPAEHDLYDVGMQENHGGKCRASDKGRHPGQEPDGDLLPGRVKGAGEVRVDGVEPGKEKRNYPTGDDAAGLVQTDRAGGRHRPHDSEIGDRNDLSGQWDHDQRCSEGGNSPNCYPLMRSRN